jgi:hypothetical protein
MCFMPITFKLDDSQHAGIVRAINQGFRDLVGALTGNDEEKLQAIIDQLATNLNLDASEIQAALKQPATKGE